MVIDPNLLTSRNKRVQVSRNAFHKLMNKVTDMEEYVRMLEGRIAKLEASPKQAKPKVENKEKANEIK